MSSLQDQLIKAGLANKHKARQANTDKKRRNKQQRSGAQVEASLQEQVKQDLAQQKQAKLAKEQDLNQQRANELAAKELAQRIKQILTHHQVPAPAGEAEYNYTALGKVKKLFTDQTTRQALVDGKLAICGISDSSFLVTRQTAEKVQQLDSNAVWLLNDKLAGDEIDEDDPYADYQIPDDLMW